MNDGEGGEVGEKSERGRENSAIRRPSTVLL